MTRTPSTLFAVILAGALPACEAPAPQLEPGNTRRPQALQTTERVVLDQRDLPEGAGYEQLAGVLEPVRPGTDALRVVVLGESPRELDLATGERVLDAAFVADGAVVLGADRVLRHHASGTVRELATDVLGPLSVVGSQLVAVAGEPPDLHLLRVDLSTGESHGPLPQLAPVWSPALSEDGREVIFVASPEGRAQLMRLDAAGELHRVPMTVERTPSSPVAPIWTGQWLTFEDEQGVVQLDLASGEVVAHDGARMSPASDSGWILISHDGQTSPLPAPQGTAR